MFNLMNDDEDEDLDDDSDDDIGGKSIWFG
jgi:hypothetical protein